MDARAEARLMVLENEVSVLRRDNEQLQEQAREASRSLSEWSEAFQLHDGQSPRAAVETKAAEQADTLKRVSQLHAALGIGPNDDPKDFVAALKATKSLNVDPATTTLPTYGLLLLMTRLAKLAGMTAFLNTPDQIRCDSGDIWYSYVEEVNDAEGIPVRTVVIRVEPNAYGYAEAMNQKTRLDGVYAQALREQHNAKAGLAQAPKEDPEVYVPCKQRFDDANARVEQLKADMEAIEPRLAPPVAKDWRYTAGLNELEIVEAA